MSMGPNGGHIDAKAVTFDLNDDAKRTSVQADGECSPYRAFAAYDAGFDCPSTPHGNDDGRQTAVEKMNVELLSVGLVETQVAW